eukprot:3931854-Pleurochrysis_carterae.AAC.1
MKAAALRTARAGAARPLLNEEKELWSRTGVTSTSQRKKLRFQACASTSHPTRVVHHARVPHARNVPQRKSSNRLRSGLAAPCLPPLVQLLDRERERLAHLAELPVEALHEL